MRWIGLIVLLSACYEPELRNCAVTCSAPADCNAAHVCAGGFCASPGVVCSENGPVDAARDSTVDDGADLCARGCTNGTCDGGVCVIDCSAGESCPTDVRCPKNLPCRVVCGDLACAKLIDCRESTACEVVCSGSGSCREEVRCGHGPCDVTCSGENSCQKKIACKESCACDARCTGIGSCDEAPECPSGDVCRLGEGCSSGLTGCETCP